ncbi:MAG: DUF4011 domain-containing protein [Myxococcota bacterium]
MTSELPPEPDRLGVLRSALLDLSFRNPLLSFRSRSTTLLLDVPDPGALEDVLAIGEPVRLEPLVTGLSEARLQKVARNAARAARTMLDEGGLHGLFLALGSVRFHASDAPDVPRIAPLLLVPVMLVRRQHRWWIERSDVEVELNPALAELLRRDHGLDLAELRPLPEDEAGVDVNGVLDTVARRLSETPTTASFEVRRDACIAILAFTRIRMWRDLEDCADTLLQHPVVRRLTLREAPEATASAPVPQGIDRTWRPADVLCPLDADGSQLAALAAADAGMSFVLEGPPGTGKSQTIANLIAHSLAHGRTVLFVSQKRAALEVVHDRLERIGLAPFCLELHSNKASRPAFIQQLREAAAFRARRPRGDWEARAAELHRQIETLSATAEDLNTPHPPGRTVFEAIVERWERGPGEPVACDFDPARATDPAWRDAARDALTVLGPARHRLHADPAALTAIRATDWNPARIDAARTALDAATRAVEAVKAACTGLDPWLGRTDHVDVGALAELDALLEAVERTPGPRLALLKGGEDDVEAWRDRVRALAWDRDTLAERFQPPVLRVDLQAERTRLATWMSWFWLVSWVMLWGVRSRARLVQKGGAPTHQALFEGYERAAAVAERREHEARNTAAIETLIGPVPVDEWGIPVVPELDPLLAYTRDLRRRAHRFPGALALAASDRPHSAAPKVSAWREAWAAWLASRAHLEATLELEPGALDAQESRHLDAVSAHLARWTSHLADLPDWGAYRAVRDTALELGLAGPVGALESGAIDAERLPTAFDDAWRQWWLDHHIARSPVLSRWSTLDAAQREARFAALDAEVLAATRAHVVARIASRLPQLDGGAPPRSAAGILLRQFKRKSGFASPRRLFAECPGLLRQLKPCVLMSPLSVAQYLDPSQEPFDLVVFDEASQVPVHEAIGAIARGRQVVVVGDSQQLPPTTFFTNTRDDDEDTREDDLLEELDSVLDECAASGLPSLRLSWHYRSRHHGLIAFSNQRYYAGDLQVLPAARDRDPRLGVRLERVDGVYDRGRTSTNPLEAEAVVAEVLRRLRDPAEVGRSLCVVTFGRQQQRVIEDLLDAARDADPTLDACFDPEQTAEPVLVKNLENVQGDERDVVLFSIGYGPDETGRMTNHFGPLGQDGGERRLNVAITRARELLVVFCSFRPRELDLSRTESRGLHDLQAFLLAADADRSELPTADDGPDPSAKLVADAIAAHLVQAGFDAHTEVGVGDWRVDVAVRRQDDPSVWALGIELDGPRHATTPTTRDRERLRPEVLAGLGWHAWVRVRILDWLRDPDAVLAGLVEAASCAQTAGPTIRDVAPQHDPADSELLEPPEPLESVYRVHEAPLGPSDGFREDHPGHVAWVRALVDTEGPLTLELAASRLASAWSTRATVRIQRALATALEASGIPVVDGVIGPAQRDAGWRGYRVPDPERPNTRRDLDQIPMQELVNAADALLARFGRTPDEDLLRELARTFGFASLGARLREPLEAALDQRRRPPSTSIVRPVK